MYFIGSLLAVFLIPLIFIFTLGVPILSAVLVYKDAVKRVDCSPWLWALVAALAPCFMGVIVYLIIRKDYPLKTDPLRAQQSYAYHSSAQAQNAGEEFGDDAPGTAEEGFAPYNDYPQEKQGLPTWGKALLIIGAVVVAICIIGAIVGVINYFTGFHHMYSDYHNMF